MADQEAPLALGEFAELLAMLLGAIVFITLIVVDMRKALKKGHPWVPGNALVLSALSIQVMNFVEHQSYLVDQALLGQKSDCAKPSNAGKINLKDEAVKNDLLMIHSSRMMLCVLVAFFLPGMARRGYAEKWTKVAAVGLSVLIDIFSELLSVKRRFAESGSHLFSRHFFSWPHTKEISFVLPGMIISITLLWLILLLICATRASKSIEEITTKRFPLILVQPQQNVPWNGVEDYVLKSWIVARISSPESIISRSVLGSSAAMALTVCIAISVVEWVAQGPVLRVLDGPRFSLKFIITNLEVVFILIGWAVIVWRTLQSVGYYGRWRDKKQSWRDYFRVEDFWTRHIHQLQKAEESKRKLEVDKCVGKMIATEETEIFWLPNFLLKMLLKCMFWLEASVIFMCRISWFVTEIPYYIGSIILPQHSVKEDTEIEGYKHILDDIKIVRENSRSLFATNRKAIMQAKELMTKGNNNGRSCHALVKILRHSKKLDAKKYPALLKFFRPRRSQAFVCIQCLDLGTANNRTGLKFLCKRDPVPVLEVDKYFMHTSKRSLKLTAVSLINIIVHLCHPGGKDCLKAYHEACELMDLVEEWDTKADILLSKAASIQFKKLWEKGAGEHNPHIRTMEDAAVAIINLANESKQEAEMQINITHDKPVDWEKIAVANTLYKLCKSVDCRSGNLPELMDELENSLAYIIRACIEKVGFALVESCRKWAENFEERKLLEAIYIAGKFEAVYMAPGNSKQFTWQLGSSSWKSWSSGDGADGTGSLDTSVLSNDISCRDMTSHSYTLLRPS